MSLTLILTRHAKSSWDDPMQDDFDRPLNARGRKSATAIGRWLAAHDLLPGEVLLSGARRTVETWAGMAAELNGPAQMRSDPALFHANAQTILATLKTADAPIVLLIGHNPGIGEFAARIASASPAHEKFAQYPTGATTIVQFPENAWADIGWAAGQALDFVVPRELT